MALTITESTLFPVRRDKQVASVGSTGSTLISGGTGGGVSDHNSLTGLQGGDSADFYHLDETQYNSMVSYSGTPVDNQIAVFSSVNTIEGNSGLTWNGVYLGVDYILENTSEHGVSIEDVILKDGSIYIDETSGGQGILYYDDLRFIHTYGNQNFFIGQGAGNFTMTSAVGRNVGIGGYALSALTDGYYNFAIGFGAMINCTSGFQNFAIGYYALSQLTTNASNVAIGNLAGQYCNAQANVYIGQESGRFNNGGGNIGIGAAALTGPTSSPLSSGAANVAIGHQAGAMITSGNYNSSLGYVSLRNISTGSSNTAVGNGAGYALTTASNSIFVGYHAGYYESGTKTLIVDSIDRTTEALSRSSALLYGIFDSNPANQTLNLGGGGKVGINITPTDSMLRVKSTTSQVSAVFGESLVTSDLGIGIGVDAESRGVNTGSNYGIYAGAANANYNYAIYIEANWPPAGANNYAIYSLSAAKSYFAGAVGINDTTPSYPLDVNGDAQIVGDLFIGEDVSGTGAFTEGFDGSGWKLQGDSSGDSTLTIDNLVVRKMMQVWELVINQIRATNGSLWVTDSAKVNAVTESTKCWIDSDGGNIIQPFEINDIIRCQRWNGRGIKYYTATVDSIDPSGEWFDITVIDGTDGPEAGDEVVRTGSTDSSSNRMGSIYITASDTNAPYIDVLDEVDSAIFTDANIKVRIGNLDGITDSNFGALDGFGLYSQKIYLSGSCYIAGVIEFGTYPVDLGDGAQNIAIKGSDIWENNGAVDGTAVSVNRIGYNQGTDYYRDFVVYDGKGFKLFNVVGSESLVQVGSELTAYSGTVDFAVYGGLYIQDEAIFDSSISVNGNVDVTGVITADDLRGDRIMLCYSGVSDTVILSHNTETSTTQTSYTKVKTITIGANLRSGTTLRVKFDLKGSDSEGIEGAYGRVYKNGVAVGTVRATNSTDYQTYSEDLADWDAGDAIELYMYASSASYAAYAQNFRVCGEMESSVRLELTGTNS